MRSLFTLLVLGVVGLPAGWPLLQSLAVWPRELDRLATLTLTTAELALLAAAVAVPLGVILGLWLTSASRLGWAGVLATAAMPLPVAAVAWQVVLGGFVELNSGAPGTAAAWRPWREGLVPAAVVHGLAGVPAVAILTALVTRTIDRNLMDLALLNGGEWEAIRRVIGPRVLLGAAAGGAWVMWQAATEIAITDAMLVRTAAEEVYTRFSTGAGGLESAVALCLPAWLVACGLTSILATRVAHRTGQVSGARLTELRLPLPVAVRAGLTLAAGLVGVLAVGVPFGALLLRAGGGGAASELTLSNLAGELANVARAEGITLFQSLVASLAAGMVAALLAAGAAWQMRTSRRAAWGWGLFAAAVAVTPGPVVGVGLRQLIFALLDREDALLNSLGATLTLPPARSLLYDQPSPVPACWAAVVRFFPVALLVLAPSARLIPISLLERARLDGLTRFTLLRIVVGPRLGPALIVATLAVAALALGEVSAARLVDPPGRGAYILRVFSQMHYGAESTVAAMGLVQMATIGFLGWVLKPNWGHPPEPTR